MTILIIVFQSDLLYKNFLEDVPKTLSKTLVQDLRPIDHAFRDQTMSTTKPLLGNPDPVDEWWWFRLPKTLQEKWKTMCGYFWKKIVK
jgi:hypothetical protein